LLQDLHDAGCDIKDAALALYVHVGLPWAEVAPILRDHPAWVSDMAIVDDWTDAFFEAMESPLDGGNR
jgi:hypothetical protein